MSLLPEPAVKEYTRSADSTGWLSVRLTKTNQLAALCEYTQVNIAEKKNGRTCFTIIDGTISVGEEAALTLANAALYLSNIAAAGAAAIIVTYIGKPVKSISAFKGELLQQWADVSFKVSALRRFCGLDGVRRIGVHQTLSVASNTAF